MPSDPFRTNLTYACSLFPSVAEVCRRIGINRQQFNKYLSGQMRPSRRNMRRICDFFGVTEWEMLLEEDRFRDLISVRRVPVRNEEMTAPLHHIEALYRESADMQRYLGYYYRYFYSFGRPGKITRSLAAISDSGGRYFWKNIEIARDEVIGSGHNTSKYTGAAFYLGERIYILEYESLMRTSITALTLYPSYKNRLDYLIGVQTGGPTRRGRRPAASLVLLEYLGRHVDLRRAMRKLGLFDEDEIDERIRGKIRNRMAEGAYVFEADDT